MLPTTTILSLPTKPTVSAGSLVLLWCLCRSYSTRLMLSARSPAQATAHVRLFLSFSTEKLAIQSIESARTKNFLALVKPSRCVGVLLLTGTPMKNGKPSNIFPLLKAVRHPIGNNRKAFEIHFCAGREKQYGHGPKIWDASGSSNLEQLRELVSTHLLHLTKDECLKDLPPARREYKHVPVSSRQEMLYSKAMKELVSFLGIFPQNF